MKHWKTYLVALCLAVASLAHHQPASARTGGCHDAVNFLWPQGSRAWAHKIVHRESRGNPRAQNRRSTAAGCFQMLKIHQGRFARLGFSWADRYNPIINTYVAMDLYREQGARPWRVG